MRTKNGAVKSVTVIGRRWFERTNGNTYHSAEILVNGAPVHKIGFTYGYGDQYEQSAWQWLVENGYAPGAEYGKDSPWRYYRDDHHVTWVSTVSDVARKKDL